MKARKVETEFCKPATVGFVSEKESHSEISNNQRKAFEDGQRSVIEDQNTQWATYHLEYIERMKREARAETIKEVMKIIDKYTTKDMENDEVITYNDYWGLKKELEAMGK